MLQRGRAGKVKGAGQRIRPRGRAAPDTQNCALKELFAAICFAIVKRMSREVMHGEVRSQMCCELLSSADGSTAGAIRYAFRMSG